MAYIKVVGNSKPIHISDHMVERLVKSKETHEPTHLVDIPGYGFVEIGQIKQIMPDDPKEIAAATQSQQKWEEKLRQQREHDMMTSAYALQSAEDKANRVVDTYALLLWTARGNWQYPGDRIPQDLREKLVARMVPYFEANPREWSCGREVYGDLIPTQARKVPHSVVKGVVSLGDAIISKF